MPNGGTAYVGISGGDSTEGDVLQFTYPYYLSFYGYNYVTCNQPLLNGETVSCVVNTVDDIFVFDPTYSGVISIRPADNAEADQIVVLTAQFKC